MTKENRRHTMANEGIEAENLIGNSASSTPFKFEQNNGHTLMFGTTRNGMSAMFEALQDQCSKAGGTVQVMDKGPTARR